MAAPRPALPGPIEVDVAIVGAGFTGLWTAYYLKQRVLDCRIAILEASTVGFGASGRNGGWCSALLPMSLTRLGHLYGRDAAIAMQRAMFATVDEVGAVAASLGLPIDFAKGGWIDLARNAAQLARIRDDLDEAAAFGFRAPDVQELNRYTARLVCAATEVVGGRFTPHCAAIHPGKLVRGLGHAVEARGVAIFENSAALAIQPGRVVTAVGDVRAEIIVRATEGYTAGLAGLRRAIAPVYSLMLATEPLPDNVWASIGLHDRSTFSDARHLVIYGQRTADGRLAFGGRGAPYHWASAIKASFDNHRPTHDALRQILIELFPALADIRITHEWGGPLGIPRDWHASVGLDRTTGLAWAGGYVGDGVGTSNLAGRTLSDLISGIETDITALRWVGHVSPKWEPEPFRWLGINGAGRLPARLDRAEAAGRSAPLSARLFGRLTGG
jgi:glycine/D-amino acid oxidase-like deaminating enzyme